MSFKVKAESGGNFGEIAPAGNHPAVLVGLIDLGTQRGEYKGNVEFKRKVFLIWELVTEKQVINKDQNHVIGRDFTLGFTPKSMLRGFIEKWRNKAFNEGEEFDLSVLLGKPCLLNVIQKTASSSDNTYAKVEGVSAVPKGMKVEKPQRKPIQWSIENKELPQEDWIPYLYGRKLSDVLAEATERGGTKPPSANGAEQAHLPAAAAVGASEEEDSIPF